MKNIALGIWFVIVLILCLLALVVLVLDYNAVCNQVDTIFHDPTKLLHFKEKYLSASKFLILKSGVLGLLILCLIALLKWRIQIIEIIRRIITSVSDELKGAVRIYKSMAPQNFRLLVGVISVSFAVSLYFAVTSPVFIDEVITFKDFTKNSLFVSASYYPQPNNHVLFSLLTNIAYAVSPFTPKITIRLINVFLAIGTNLLFYRLARRLLSESASVISTTVFAFLFMNLLYSFQARGYEMILCMTIIVLTVMMRYSEQGGGTKYLMLYSIAGVVGLWTIPSFLYPFGIVTASAVCVLVIKKRMDLVVKLGITGVLTGIMTVVVYSPILFISGLSAITGNYYTKPIPRGEVASRLLPHFESTAQWLVGLSSECSSVVVLVIAICVLTVAVIKGHTAFGWCIAVLLSPPLIVMIHSVIPFERTWVYLSIPLAIAIGWAMEKLLFRLPKGSIYPLVVVIILSGIMMFTARHPEIYARDYCLDTLVQHIDSTHRSSSIVYDSDYDAETFRFALFTLDPSHPYVPMVQLTDTTKVDTFGILLLAKEHPFRTKSYDHFPMFTLVSGSDCGTTLYLHKPR